MPQATTSLRLLSTAEPHPRSATRPPLARAVGPLDLAPRRAPRTAGRPMPTVNLTRFTPAVSPCSVVAQGDAVEVGVTYGFMVFGDDRVALNSPRGIVPGHHKAALRAAISAAHRAATAEAAR